MQNRRIKIHDDDWEEVDAFCFKARTLAKRRAHTPENASLFSIDLHIINKLDYETLRNIHQESYQIGLGGAASGLRITSIPSMRKKYVPPDSDYSTLMCDKSRAKPLPLHPLATVFKDFALKTVYLSNYFGRTHFAVPYWVKPTFVLHLARDLEDSLTLLIFRSIQAFQKGKFSQPLETVGCTTSRSSRSASASAVQHGQSSQRSGVGTDSEVVSHRSRLHTSRQELSNISSSDPELSFILRREVSNLFERNQKFLDPSLMTKNSHSNSQSPNTSESKEYSSRNDGCMGNYYDDALDMTYYYPNAYCYPYQSQYLCPQYPVEAYAQNYGESIPKPKKLQTTQSNSQALSAAAKPFGGKSTESKKEEASAAKREESKKVEHAMMDPIMKFRQSKLDSHSTLQKEEKRFADNIKPKTGVRKPLGNAAENTIRQIMNRKKLISKVKYKDDKSIDNSNNSARRAKSKDTSSPVPETFDVDILSDIYPPLPRRKEAKKETKRWLNIKKGNRQTQGVIALNPIRNIDSAGVFSCYKKANIRDKSEDARERVARTGGGREWNRDPVAIMYREGKRGRIAVPPRKRQKEFEEDRINVRERKASLDIIKWSRKSPGPEHKASVEFA